MRAAAIAFVAACACGRLGYDAEPGADAADTPFVASPTVQITTHPEDSDEPDVVFADGSFAIAFHDSRSGNEDIHFARIDLDGTVLIGPVNISANAGISRDADVATSGADFGIAWNDSTAGNVEILFARVAADGQILQGPLQVTDDPAESVNPDVVFDGSDYLLFWDDDRSGDRQLFRARVGAAGITLPEAVLSSTSADSARHPAAARLGATTGVAWQDFRDGSEIWFAQVDSTGTIQGGEVRVTTSDVPSRFPDLESRGSDLVLAFEDDRTGQREIWLTEIDEVGGVIATPVQVSSAIDIPGNPKLASGSGIVAVVWSEGTQVDSEDIYYALVDEAGVVVQTARLAADVNAKLPSVAFDGVGFGVFWDDERNGDGDIFYSRLAPASQ